MTRYILYILFLVSTTDVLSQVPVFDKLELLYSQGHYRMVYRRANRLLDVPDYDYSHLPEFYKSLSGFQLSQDEHWLIRHPKVLEESAELFKGINRASDGRKVLEAHIMEISFLKRDLISRAEDLKRSGKKAEFEQLYKVIADLFDDIPYLDIQPEPMDRDSADLEEEAFLNAYVKERDALVNFAKTQLGVPYVWAGNDPNGFDCSGFTCYVMRNAGKELPRRAIEQYDSSRKVKQRHAQKGDLVFFDSGSGVSHVGMLISERGKPLVMIHASSSKGVIITDIEQSDYWLKRLKGFGTFVY
jgi:hypothetical protein